MNRHKPSELRAWSNFTVKLANGEKYLTNLKYHGTLVNQVYSDYKY